MSLVFKILQSPGGKMDNQAFSISEMGATIGNLPHNDIVLANDPAIAKQHAMIQFQGGTFRLFDTSNTGVYVNNSHTALNTTAAISTELSDNDILRMGQYLIQVNKDDNTISQSDTDLDIDALLSTDTKPILAAENPYVEHASSYGAFSGSELYHDLGVDHSFNRSSQMAGEFNIDDFLNGTLENQHYEKNDEIDELLTSSAPASGEDILATLDQYSAPAKEIHPFSSDEPLDLDSLLNFAMDDKTESAPAPLPMTRDEEFDTVEIFTDYSTPSAILTATTDETIDLLIQQLGLGHLKIDNKTLLTENIAFLLKALIDNVIQANRQRRNSQKQLQIQSRALEVSEDNPIAYANNAQDVLAKLLFKTPAEIEDAVQDCFIKQAQYEADLFVAAQEAFVDYLEKFAPHLIDNIMKSEIDVKRGIFQVKRRNFKHYVSYYRDVIDHAKKEFNETVGKCYRPGAGTVEKLPPLIIADKSSSTDEDDAQFVEEMK